MRHSPGRGGWGGGVQDMEDDGEGAGDRPGGVLPGAPTELAVTPSGGPGWVLDRFLLPPLLLLVMEGIR